MLLRLRANGDDAEAVMRWKKLESAGVVIQNYFMTADDLLPDSLVTTIMVR
jgi:hypothetical protein